MVGRSWPYNGTLALVSCLLLVRGIPRGDGGAEGQWALQKHRGMCRCVLWYVWSNKARCGLAALHIWSLDRWLVSENP